MAKANGELKIEKGIPAPRRGMKRGKYPWADMQVGDSVFAENVSSQSLWGSSSTWSKRNREGKWKFAVKREGYGARVWRIK